MSDRLMTQVELAHHYKEKGKGEEMTRSQENYIAHLMNMLGWSSDEREKFWRDKGAFPLSLTKKEASEVIDDLKDKLYQRG